MQAGARRYPEPKLPGQHLSKPGREADLELKPMYEAPYYQGSDKLRDMVAIVTGGDSGLGRAVAMLFAREGADVAVAYLNEDQDAEETKRAVENEGRRCILLPGDVADPVYCRDAVKKTIDAFGKLDIRECGVSGTRQQARRYFRRALRPHHKDEPLWLFQHGEGGGPQDEDGWIDRHDRFGHRAARQQTSSRLFADQRRHPCLCALAWIAARRSWHSRQRGRAGAGMNPAQSGRQAGKGGRKVQR